MHPVGRMVSRHTVTVLPAWKNDLTAFSYKPYIAYTRTYLIFYKPQHGVFHKILPLGLSRNAIGMISQHLEKVQKRRRELCTYVVEAHLNAGRRQSQNHASGTRISRKCTVDISRGTYNKSKLSNIGYQISLRQSRLLSTIKQ